MTAVIAALASLGVVFVVLCVRGFVLAVAETVWNRAFLEGLREARNLPPERLARFIELYEEKTK